MTELVIANQPTKVIFDGELGARFGTDWELYVSTPSEALKMVDVNIGGVFAWIRDNLAVYENYTVTCEYQNGQIEEIEESQLSMQLNLKSIRFTPIIEGAGNVMRIIAGVALIIVGAVVSYFGYGAGMPLIQMGAGLLIGGVVGLLTQQPRMDQNKDADNKAGTSHYFNGPVNTERQGLPVPLIYGDKVLVGSHPVSVEILIEEEVLDA